MLNVVQTTRALVLISSVVKLDFRCFLGSGLRSFRERGPGRSLGSFLEWRLLSCIVTCK